MNEFEFIHSKLSQLSPPKALNDDAFIYEGTTVITKDIIVEGTHFLSGTSPCKIAQKAIRVNLSDIAAMGGKPYGYFLGLVLNNTSDEWLNQFVSGLSQDNNLFNIKLLGGDTTKSNGNIMISITMLGRVEPGKALTRAGAEPGDAVYVSGTIGDAALGLLTYTEPSLATFSILQEKYELPQPQIDLSQDIKIYASSCIDISDGLIQDVQHICNESQVGIEIYVEKIPLSQPVAEIIASNSRYLELALTGGDDYQLLFTSQVEINHLDITKIGVVTVGSSAHFLDEVGQKLELLNYGYKHF